jgi:hypothetical protein
MTFAQIINRFDTEYVSPKYQVQSREAPVKTWPHSHHVAKPPAFREISRLLDKSWCLVQYIRLPTLISCHQYRSIIIKQINPTCPNQTGLQKKQPWYLIQEKMPLPSFQPIIQNFGVCPPKTQDKKENAVVTQTQSSNPSELPNCPKHNYKNRESPSIHLALALVPHLETSRNSDALLDILESLDLFQRTSAHADFFE